MQNEKSESPIIKVIDLTIDTFGKYRATQLSAWTHRPGSPWDKTVHGDASNEGAGLYGFIPDEYIREYFSTSVNQYKKRLNMGTI